MAMTPEQKIKWALLTRACAAGDVTYPVATIAHTDLEKQIDDLYQKLLVDEDLHWDLINEFRSGEVETDINPDHPFERGLTYYEKKSVAAQMPDGSWVGWIYWYGGGKHSEPEAIDWMNSAYEVAVEEKPVQIIQRTFTKVAGFTLIELLIVIAIIGIFAAVIFGPKNHETTPAVGGPANYRNHDCVAGYVTLKGNQIIDKEGKGVPCN